MAGNWLAKLPKEAPAVHIHGRDFPSDQSDGIREDLTDFRR
jgi:hypothetical protein